MKRMVIAIGLAGVIMSGCTTQLQLNQDIVEDSVVNEDFIITDFDQYIKERFSVTDYVYSYDNITELYPSLQRFIYNNTVVISDEEIKELSYHVLNKYPTYLGTKEENIHTIIALEYILDYMTGRQDLIKLDKSWGKLYEAISSVHKVYIHTYLGSEMTQSDIENLRLQAEKIHNKLLSTDFYNHTNTEDN